jgi:aryl-phospho-beta-D-glucosidase BglC (GH1 family)
MRPGLTSFLSLLGGLALGVVACSSSTAPEEGSGGSTTSTGGMNGSGGSTVPPANAVTYTPVGGTAPGPSSILGSVLTSPPPGARGIVNRFDHTIRLYLPGADVSSVIPVVVLADGVTISSPPPGPIDLSAPVTYHLSDGSTYVVSAITTPSPLAATVNGWLATGINLGNDLDAWPDEEGSWTEGVVAQEYFFDDYRTMGFNSVRIPITWGGSANPADRLSDEGAASVVNPTFMSRVDTVTGWAIDAGLTVVINAHHEDWIRTLTGPAYQAQKPRFMALWTQIAEHFKSWPPQLVFEILNEPNAAMTNDDVNDLNATILGIIRITNPERTVILGANDWNAMSALQDGRFSVPASANDPHIIVNFHNYDPWSFCGNAIGTWGSASDVAAMARGLDSVAAWASARGVPLYMGEYGVTMAYAGTITDPASRTAWYRQVSNMARAREISMAIWDQHATFDPSITYGDMKVYDRVKRTCDRVELDAVFGR